MKDDETARRRSITNATGTDFTRWSDPNSLKPAWDARAKLAAAYIAPGTRVLDLGCGAMALERYLSDGCVYLPCDLAARDQRTLVCDFNADEFPAGIACDLVTVLGVLEYLADVPGFLAKLRALGCPAIISYSVTDRDGPSDRRALGWANDYTQAELLDLLAAAGLPGFVGSKIENGQILLRAEPVPIPLPRTVVDARAAIARLAACMVPAHSQILGVGEESRTLGPFQPIGCSYVAMETMPEETGADIIVMLGDTPIPAEEMATAAHRLGKPLICVWPVVGTNNGSANSLREAMRRVGFRLQCSQQPTPLVELLKWVPDVEFGPAVERRSTKRVLVMSHFNNTNFGDRLGYHVLNSILPADAEVTWGAFQPWQVPDRDYDLLILGIGTSLLSDDACNPKLADLMEKIPQAIGIFGTQFRYHFQHPAAARALNRILEKLTTWWARYEEDILAFGKGRTNVRHLGDWLVSAFPIAVPTAEKGLTIPPTIADQDLSLDRLIQKVQAYRDVFSGRLHPLLCALTSAKNAAYLEQRLDRESNQESGKFRSLLYDVFGQTFEENTPFPVDQDAVIRYKKKVESNLVELRAQLAHLL